MVWEKEALVIYCPMYRQEKHWVGFLFNTNTRDIEILNPCISATNDPTVEELMRPVIEMMPWLLAANCGTGYSITLFKWTRSEDVYQIKKFKIADMWLLN